MPHLHHIEYMPSGELFAEQRDYWHTPYRFNGKELDEETGYYYYGARYYTPEIGVWLSVDPQSDQRSWLSPYNYCQLNPVILVDPDGELDDGYTVDECGYFNKVDDAGGDKFDVIYSNKKDGTPNFNLSKSHCLEKGVLQNIKQGNNNGFNFDYTELNSTQEGVSALKFLSANTKVEWGVEYFKDGNREISVLMTSHDELMQAGSVAMMGKYDNMLFLGNDHNHPDAMNNPFPSSSSLPLGDPGRKHGDIGYADFMERNKNPKAVFRVYDSRSDSFFNYDSKTVVPRVLPEFIVK